MASLIQKMYYSPILGNIFHTTISCLQKALKDCESVLDLGCGPSSPLHYCKNINYSVGVEVFKEYLEISKQNNIHTTYLGKNFFELDFEENSFDAVILIEVLEHMTEAQGMRLLQLCNKWARKKIIVTTPNGYFPMGAVDGNEFQRHLSGWDINKLEILGFKCNGLQGLKFFYRSHNTVHSLSSGNENNVYSNYRFQPKKLFYIINALCQLLIFYFPKFSFGLFAIKEKDSK